MTTPYPGDPDNYPTNIDLPEDSDLSNETALDAALQELGDRTAYLKAQLDDEQSWLHSVAMINRVMCTMGTPETLGSLVTPKWELTAGGLWRSYSGWTGGRVFYVLELPDQCLLNNIYIYLTTATGHSGWPVQHPVSATLYGPGVLASITDIADDVSYETPHELAFIPPLTEGLDITINRGTTRYVVAVNNEYGTNSIAAGLTIGNITCRISPAVNIDKGAG